MIRYPYWGVLADWYSLAEASVAFGMLQWDGERAVLR